MKKGRRYYFIFITSAFFRIVIMKIWLFQFGVKNSFQVIIIVFVIQSLLYAKFNSLTPGRWGYGLKICKFQTQHGIMVFSISSKQ